MECNVPWIWGSSPQLISLWVSAKNISPFFRCIWKCREGSSTKRTKNCRQKFLSPDGTFMHYWTQTLSLPLFSVEIDADSDGANVRVKRSKNEQNTTSIRQIVKIALRHATRIQKFPKETGYLSRGSGAANLKTARKCVSERVGTTFQEKFIVMAGFAP